MTAGIIRTGYQYGTVKSAGLLSHDKRPAESFGQGFEIVVLTHDCFTDTLFDGFELVV